MNKLTDAFKLLFIGMMFLLASATFTACTDSPYDVLEEEFEECCRD